MSNHLALSAPIVGCSGSLGRHSETVHRSSTLIPFLVRSHLDDSLHPIEHSFAATHVAILRGITLSLDDHVLSA